MADQDSTNKIDKDNAKQNNTSKSDKSARTSKSPKKRKKKKPADLLYWHYDNVSYAGLALKVKGKYSYAGDFKTESERNKAIKEIDDREKKERLKIKGKRLKLPIGIERFSKDYEKHHEEPKLTQEHIRQFQKMIQYSAGVEQRRPVLELVSVILSSYIMRYIAKFGGESDFSSLDGVDFLPMNTAVSEHENAFYALQKICRSVIIRPEGLDKKTPFRIKLPVAIPSKGMIDFTWQGSPDIIDCAWLKVRGCDNKFPVPCRDTAVLFDLRFLNRNEFQDFSKRNPWCSCITYGKKVKQVFGITTDIKGSALAGIDIDWDEAKVNELTQAYVADIVYWFMNYNIRSWQAWRDAGVYLEHYLQSHKSERNKYETCFRHKVKLVTMISFLRFARKWIDILDDELIELQNTILNTLLPGCVTPQPDTPPAQQKPPLEVFEDVLNLILTEEELKHFCLVPKKRGSPWPTSTAVGDEVWGYFKNYKWSEEDGEKNPCLIIFHDKLKELVWELDPELLGFDKVMTFINTKKRPDYIHGTLNAKPRFTKGEDPNTTPAYRMKIADLPINEDVKRRLLEMATADE